MSSFFFFLFYITPTVKLGRLHINFFLLLLFLQ